MDKRTKARLSKLEAAILEACKRRRDEPNDMMVSIQVAIEHNMALALGHFNDRPYATVSVLIFREVELRDAYRIGKNMGDDFFELKLLPSEDAVAAQAEEAEYTNIFVPTSAEAIVICYSPKEVQRIIRLIDAI